MLLFLSHHTNFFFYSTAREQLSNGNILEYSGIIGKLFPSGTISEYQPMLAFLITYI